MADDEETNQPPLVEELMKEAQNDLKTHPDAVLTVDPKKADAELLPINLRFGLS